jgi:phage shock protein C
MSDSKRFVRKRKGKILLGLMSGLGDYFNVDPIIFRMGAVILLCTTAGLSVLVFYFVFSLIVPYGD